MRIPRTAMARALCIAFFALAPVSASAVTVDQIVAMSKAGVSEAVILALLDRDGTVLTIDPELLPTSSGARLEPREPAAAGRSDSDGGDLATVQRDHILNMLRKTNWVIEGARGAARALGMKPATLRHRMKKLGISRATDAPAS